MSPRRLAPPSPKLAAGAVLRALLAGLDAGQVDPVDVLERLRDVAPLAAARGCANGGPRTCPGPEAQRLARLLMEAHGTARAAAEAAGVSASQLPRWAGGWPARPGSLLKLRQAAAALARCASS